MSKQPDTELSALPAQMRLILEQSPMQVTNIARDYRLLWTSNECIQMKKDWLTVPISVDLRGMTLVDVFEEKVWDFSRPYLERAKQPENQVSVQKELNTLTIEEAEIEAWIKAARRELQAKRLENQALGRVATDHGVNRTGDRNQTRTPNGIEKQ
jgi:hypothetical protein